MDKRILTITYLYQNLYDNLPVPIIRLQGRWLEELDFFIGRKIVVRQKKGKLLITLKADEKQQ